MLINVLCVNFDLNGSVETITVTDDVDIRDVTPRMLFDAIITGKMESQTARISIIGIDVLVEGNIISIPVKLSAADKKLVNIYLGIAEEPKSKKTKTSGSRTVKEKGPSEKELRLAAEREAYKQRQAQWFDENKRKADEARAKGLINLSDEERRKLRVKINNQ